MVRVGWAVRASFWSILAAVMLPADVACAAQTVDTSSQPSSAESRLRAARLTFAQGEVTVETAEIPGNQPAQTNLPLFPGVHLSTGNDGEAEVEFEDGSVIRLTPDTTVSFDTLSVDFSGVFTTAVTLLNGLAYAELRATPNYHYTLAAGEDMLSPVENTAVRVEFDHPPAAFAVIDGTATVSSRGDAEKQQVHAGETLRGSEQDNGGYSISQGISGESWDTWNNDRDAAGTEDASSGTGVRDAYAGAQGYGWADLDANGTWYDVPGQGQIWQPTVAVEDASFDPYGFGAWTWFPGPGYLWASGYPWGWTPYRCGAWSFFTGFGWGWSPGPGCGGFGWAFRGVGAPVNIAIGPAGYRVPVVPRPHPGPVHPILPTRHEPAAPPAALAGQMGWGTLLQRGPRQLNGVIAMPVQRRNPSAIFSAGARSGALVRDFPVDSNSHVAVTGRVPSQPALVHTPSGWNRETTSPVPVYTGQSGAAVFRQRQQNQEPPRGSAEVPGNVPHPVESQPRYPRSEYVSPSGQRGPAAAWPHPVQRPAYTPAPPYAAPMYTPPSPTYTPAPHVERPYTPPGHPPDYMPPAASAPHAAPPPTLPVAPASPPRPRR